MTADPIAAATDPTKGADLYAHERTCTCPECTDDDRPRCPSCGSADNLRPGTLRPGTLQCACGQFMPDDDQGDDAAGHVFCFHGRYFIGDKHDHRDTEFSGWDEFEQHLIREHGAAFIAPVYAYIHGAIRVKVGSFYGLLPQGHAEFDSGRVGFVFATRREMRKALHQPRGPIDPARALRALTRRVEVLDEYLNDPDGIDLDD